MIQVTVKHYELKWTSRAMQQAGRPTINTAILESEPDYTVLGEPTVEWLTLNDTSKQRQFLTRDYSARIDHVFVVDTQEVKR